MLSQRLPIAAILVLLMTGAWGCSPVTEQPFGERVDTESLTSKSYIVDMNDKGWRTQLWVNGILVAERNNMLGDVITQYVIEGTNHMRVVSQSLSETGPFNSIKIKIACLQYNKETLEPISTDVLLNPIRCDKKDGRQEQEFEFVAHPSIKWSWTKAAEIKDFTSQDREEIIGIVKSLYNAMMTCDMKRYDELMEIVIHEHALHDGDSEKRFYEFYHKDLKAVSGGWELRPISEIKIIPCGKMIVVKGDGEETGVGETWIVRTPNWYKFGSNQSKTYISRMGFSKIDGHWKIVLLLYNSKSK